MSRSFEENDDKFEIVNLFYRDAKIAALEKTSQETEKIIAEARSEKIRHMDEVHASQKKVADLESKFVQGINLIKGLLLPFVISD